MNSYEAWIEQIKREYLEKIQGKMEIAYRRASARFLDDARSFIQNKFEEAADEFYSDYTPIKYNRRYTLKNVLDLDESKPGRLRISFDPTEMPYRDGGVGSEINNWHGSLYELVFRQGWHGGAKYVSQEKVDEGSEPHPNPGIPYWRQPHPYYTHWSEPAYRSYPSPLGRMLEARDEWNATVDYRWNRILTDEINRSLS